MKPWNRQHQEPARWYARFDVYRNLGTRRTIDECYRCVAQVEGLRASRPGSLWYETAKHWNWSARAEAWDAAERERLRTIEADRRFDAREQRLSMIDQLLMAIFNVLVVANLAKLTQDEARSWVPTLRVMFKDLVTAQRAELGLPDTRTIEGETVQPFTADDLAAAEKELQHWQQKEPAFILLRNSLTSLYPDPASARRIAEEADLDLSHIPITGTAINNWHAIITEAQKTDHIDHLINIVRREYGNSTKLNQAISTYQETS